MLVSIVIPVYNVEKYIGQCLESCISQTYQNIEVIVVNDGSADLSGAIAEEYSRKDSRIHIYHQSNQGVVVAREYGIQQSKGTYICFVDSDDFIAEDTISNMMGNVSDFDIISCDFFLYNDCTNSSSIRKNYYLGEDTNSAIESLYLRKCTWSLWGKLFRRHLFDKNRRRWHSMLSIIWKCS